MPGTMDHIASTTSTSTAADQSGDRRLARFAGGALALAIGLLLLALGIPRLDAAVAGLRAEAVLAALQSHTAPGPAIEQLTAASDAAARSLRLAADAETATLLGRLRFASALAIGLDSPEGQRLLAESRAATQSALALAPGLPVEWLQLSYENLLGAGGVNSAIMPLRMSLRTGRYTYRLLVRRLDLALQLWANLDPSLRQEFEDQVRAGARANVYYIVTLAWHHHRVSDVRRMLADQPEALATFEKDLIWQGPDNYAIIQTSP